MRAVTYQTRPHGKPCACSLAHPHFIQIHNSYAGVSKAKQAHLPDLKLLGGEIWLLSCQPRTKRFSILVPLGGSGQETGLCGAGFIPCLAPGAGKQKCDEGRDPKHWDITALSTWGAM